MKKKPILIGTAAVLLAAVGIGAAVFGNQLRTVLSVAQSATMDEEDRAARAEESAQMEQDQRDRYHIPENGADAELSAAYEEGSLSLEEAAALLLESGGAGTNQDSPAPAEVDNQEEENSPPSASEEESPAQTPSGSTDSTTVPVEPSSGTVPAPAEEPHTTDSPSDAPAPPSEPQTPEKSQEEERLRNLVAQMYVLRGAFSSRIDGIVASCIAEYQALDPSDQNQTNKMRIAYAKLDEIASLEADCDSQVASIVAQIRSIDPEEADRVQRQYENEKAAKKAALVDQYG